MTEFNCGSVFIYNYYVFVKSSYILCVYSVVKMVLYSLCGLIMAAPMGHVTNKFNSNIFNDSSLLFIGK